MNVLPIQVTDEGVMIPRVYLREAVEVEVEVTSEYVIVRPKNRPSESFESSAPLDKRAHIYSPRLANRDQMKDFVLEMTTEP